MPTVIGYLREILLLPIYLMAGVLGYIFPLQATRNKNNSKPAIVFIHGWMTQNPLYVLLKKHLEKQGFQVYMTNFGLQTGDFHHLAQKLNQFLSMKNLNDVVLVGVSGGAIISLTYLQLYGGWSRVKKFIGIGGPYHGTPLAILALFSKAGRQMLPNSQFIKELNLKHLINPERIVSITGSHDEIVPLESAKLAGAKNIQLPTVGHVYLQAFSTETLKLIAQEAKS